ncbi:hypothetical protein [Amycolatopsis sp. lyj-23]|uniref:hypothetical protein n=1 Tax=Amycolatopsis sp. lyj-23 TaxID=2789283 RepID=UPI00397DBE0D
MDYRVHVLHQPPAPRQAEVENVRPNCPRLDDDGIPVHLRTDTLTALFSIPITTT